MALQLGALADWRWAPFLVPLSMGVTAVGVVMLLNFLFPIPYDAAEHRLCDRAVAALLHSKDLVEVQRAGIFIRELNCGIGRRLTENGE